MGSLFEQYRSILAACYRDKAPECIANRVISRIQNIELRRIRIRLIGYFVVCASAFVAIIPGTIWLINAIQYSGFNKYISLFFSEGISIFSNWKALILSMLESLPIFETACVLGILLLMANMLRMISRTVSDRESLLLSRLL